MILSIDIGIQEYKRSIVCVNITVSLTISKTSLERPLFEIMLLSCTYVYYFKTLHCPHNINEYYFGQLGCENVTGRMP